MSRVEDDCAAGHCVTCSDEGVPMRVIELGADGVAACLDDDGTQHDVLTDLVGAPLPGDIVLVHAGVALARLEEGAVA
jgi:hydrogenase assembly chaperone HypC/HupF